MGTDIHMFIEYRMNGGTWKLDPNHVYDPQRKGFTPAIIGYRNYELFGALAQVRSFDGAEPKGLPLDVSKALADDFDVVGHYVHSLTWMTVPEFKYIVYGKYKRYKRSRYKVPRTKYSLSKLKDIVFNYYGWTHKYHPVAALIQYCENLPKINPEIMLDAVAECYLLKGKKPKLEVRMTFWFDS